MLWFLVIFVVWSVLMMMLVEFGEFYILSLYLRFSGMLLNV